MDFEEWKMALRDVPIEDICDAADISRNGKLILCPDHPDRNFGSCTLYKNRYHCFACGGKGDGIQLIRSQFGIPWMEAAKWIGAHFGIPEPDSVPQQGTMMPFTRTQLCLMGLEPYGSKPFLVKEYTDYKPESWETFIADPEGYQIGIDGPTFSMEQLYHEDKESYFFLVRGKFIETIPHYLAWYKKKMWKHPFWRDLGIQKVLEYALEQLQPVYQYLKEQDPNFPAVDFPAMEIHQARFQITF